MDTEESVARPSWTWRWPRSGRGHERGVVTREEVHERLEELERLLWRRVLGRLQKVTPGASVYVGFTVGKEPAQKLA